MPQIVFPEFRDSTKSTSYPFVDTASLTDTTEQIILPKDAFIDASIYLTESTSTVFLSSIDVTKNSTKIRIEDTSDPNIYCESALIDIRGEDEDVVIPLFNSYGTRAGVLVCNGLLLSFFRNIPFGTFTFENDATAFVPTCVIPIVNNGVKTLAFNSRYKDNIIDGDVWIIGHNGVQLSTQEGIDNSIRIDVMGDPMFKKAALGVTEYRIDTPLQSINGVRADEYGNLYLTTTSGDDALRIVRTPTGVKIFIAGANDGD